MTAPIGGFGGLMGIAASPRGIAGVGASTGITGATAPRAAGAASSSGTDFASVLTSSLDQLQAAQTKSNDLAVQAATGDLRDVHDYMIASSEAGLATQMVVTLKNQAVNAFNEIMRMPV